MFDNNQEERIATADDDDDDGNGRASSPPTSGRQLVANFGDTLSHHMDLGLGIDVPSTIGGDGSVSVVSGLVVDAQSVANQERAYLRGYDAEREGVLSFRLLILRCIETYVHAFHNRSVGIKGGGAEDGADCDGGGNGAEEGTDPR